MQYYTTWLTQTNLRLSIFLHNASKWVNFKSCCRIRFLARESIFRQVIKLVIDH